MMKHFRNFAKRLMEVKGRIIAISVGLVFILLFVYFLLSSNYTIIKSSTEQDYIAHSAINAFFEELSRDIDTALSVISENLYEQGSCPKKIEGLRVIKDYKISCDNIQVSEVDGLAISYNHGWLQFLYYPKQYSQTKLLIDIVSLSKKLPFPSQIYLSYAYFVFDSNKIPLIKPVGKSWGKVIGKKMEFDNSLTLYYGYKENLLISPKGSLYVMSAAVMLIFVLLVIGYMFSKKKANLWLSRSEDYKNKLTEFKVHAEAQYVANRYFQNLKCEVLEWSLKQTTLLYPLSADVIPVFNQINEYVLSLHKAIKQVGNNNPPHESINIEKLVKEILGALEAKQNNKQIIYKTELKTKGREPVLSIDRLTLIYILASYLQNISRYTKTESTTYITVQQDESATKLTISFFHDQYYESYKGYQNSSGFYLTPEQIKLLFSYYNTTITSKTEKENTVIQIAFPEVRTLAKEPKGKVYEISKYKKD